MKFRSFYRTFFLKNSFRYSSPLNLLAWFGVLAINIAAQNVNAQTNIEDIAKLREKVAHFLTDEYRQGQATKVEIKVGALDARLRLAACDQELALNLQDTNGSGGNINVQVACRGASRWTILVPAQAIVFRPMAIASRNLERGQIITAADIVSEPRESSLYRQGFSLEADSILGKELKYAVTKGDAFRNSALEAPMVIKRGEEVSVEAIAGSIRVVTNGVAISDGRLGQQIRVKNSQSERIINAKVVGPGKVQSIL